MHSLSDKPPRRARCWPVLTEAAYLLQKYTGGVGQMFQSFDSGAIRVMDLVPGEGAQVARFLAQYRSLGVDLEDAVLMHLADREHIDTIFTLDRRDFSVYRTSGGRALRVVPE